MRLERALARKVSHDLISRDMTIASLAASLDAARPTPNAELPVIYLISGVFGDGPDLADLRRAMDDRWRFELIDHPISTSRPGCCRTWRPPGSTRPTQLWPAQETRDIFVAGTSFGASVGVEAVRCLIAAGCRVPLYINLDGMYHGSGTDAAITVAEMHQPRLVAVRPSLASRFRRGAHEGWRDYTGRVAVAAAMAAGRIDVARRLVLAAAGRIDLELGIVQRRHVLGHCRARAIATWHPASIAPPMFLAISDEMAAAGIGRPGDS